MLSSERSVETDSFIISYGHWHVKELSVDGPKVRWLWEETKKHPTLFSDLTRDNQELFLNLLQDKSAYFLEVVDDDDKTLGILYITDLFQVIDASLHVMFFDHKPTEKAMLIREMIQHIFEKFPYLHRLTISVPSIYFATIRLATKIGFKEEGRKRESRLIRHKWCDETILGLLASEIS